MIRSSEYYQRLGTQTIDAIDDFPSIEQYRAKVNYHAIMMMRVMIEKESRSVEDALRYYKSIFAWFLPESLVAETELKLRNFYPNPEGSYENAIRPAPAQAEPAHL